MSGTEAAGAAAFKSKKNHVTPEWVAERRAALPGELLRAVAQAPGLTLSHYVMRRLVDGGLRGLTDDKYAAFNLLIQRGDILPGRSRSINPSARGWYPADYPGDRNAEPPNSLERQLRGLVLREPGRSASYYCRLPQRAGGLPGAQERKERALAELLRAGELERRALPRAAGRQTHGIWPAGQNPA